MERIYIIEFAVTHEHGFEDQDAQMVLDGIGYFESAEEAYRTCIDLADEEIDDIATDDPKALFSKFDANPDKMCVKFICEENKVQKTIEYFVTGLDRHSNAI